MPLLVYGLQNGNANVSYRESIGNQYSLWWTSQQHFRQHLVNQRYQQHTTLQTAHREPVMAHCHSCHSCYQPCGQYSREYRNFVLPCPKWQLQKILEVASKWAPCGVPGGVWLPVQYQPHRWSFHRPHYGTPSTGHTLWYVWLLPGDVCRGTIHLSAADGHLSLLAHGPRKKDKLWSLWLALVDCCRADSHHVWNRHSGTGSVRTQWSMVSGMKWHWEPK